MFIMVEPQHPHPHPPPAPAQWQLIACQLLCHAQFMLIYTFTSTPHEPYLARPRKDEEPRESVRGNACLRSHSCLFSLILQNYFLLLTRYLGGTKLL